MPLDEVQGSVCSGVAGEMGHVGPSQYVGFNRFRNKVMIDWSTTRTRLLVLGFADYGPHLPHEDSRHMGSW